MVKNMNEDKFILFGAGNFGRTALMEYGAERIICFCDNDEKKWGKHFCGKPVISFDELVKRGEKTGVVITIQNKKAVQEIGEQLSEYGFDYECYDADSYRGIMTDYTERAKSYKRQMDVLVKWFKLEQYEKGLVDYLCECNMHSALVRGTDALSICLKEMLCEDERIILKSISDIETEGETCDVIIVTNPVSGDELSIVSEHYNCKKVYSLKELVDAAYFRYLLAPIEMEGLK